jgi:hypothetical protein
LVNYLGFPFWDVLTFSVTTGRDAGELHEILVDRAKAGHSILINEPVDSRSSEQFYTDFLILTSENQDDRDAKAKRPGFQFTFQKDAHPASSNRTEPTSGEGKAHAFSRCVVHAQAKKPVPSMRR